MKRIPGVRPVMALVFSGVMLFAVSNLTWSAESPGEATFKSKCVLCHGEDGTGNTPLGKQLRGSGVCRPASRAQEGTRGEGPSRAPGKPYARPGCAPRSASSSETFGKSAKK